MDRDFIIEKLKMYNEKSEYKDKIKELGVFGSAAKGNSKLKSDIDIFVKFEPARMFDLISIKTDIEKLLGRKVDIIALRKSMNGYLKNEMKNRRIYV